MLVVKQLLLFPFAGGGGSSYGSLTNNLERGWNSRVVMRSGKNLTDSVSTFAEAVEVSSVAANQCLDESDEVNDSVIFYGHSLGALVAANVVSKMATRLTGRKSALWVSGAPGPSFPRPLADRADVTQLSDEQFVARIRDTGAAPPELLTRSVLTAFIPFLRAEYAVAESVAPHVVRIMTTLHVVAGLRDPVVPEDGWAYWRSVADQVEYHTLVDADHGLPTTHAASLGRLLTYEGC
ncbi:thioesterase II family protein [Kocuria salsicia]|uniref:thioesterase II family protein n=1 Tax=Kocuria salsicia TaxID=664639 RepID=UPI0021B6E361|nr:alpha/beta fold hydrolase [Kocuria salsicia]